MKRQKILDICILILFVAYLAFYMQDHVSAVLCGFDLASTGNTAVGKAISISLLVLANIRSYTSKSNLPHSLKAILACWCVYIPISNMFNQTEVAEIFNITFQQWLWPSILLYFYNYSQDGETDILLKILFVGLTLFMSFQVYLEANMIRDSIAIASMLQVNEIYYLILILPWIFLFNGKHYNVIKILLLVLILWLTFYSLKRTAMVAVGFAFFAYLLALLKQRKLKVSTVFGISVLFIVSYNLLLSVNAEFGGRIFERFGDMESDQGSGRIDIYKDVIEAVNNFDIGHFMFGGGRGNIGKYTHGYSAHNEFLEVLFSWGVIGLILYIIFLVKLFVMFIRSDKHLNIYPLKVASLGIFIAMSITSHLVIYPYLFCILTSFWGYCLCYKNKQNFNKN